MSVSPLIIHTFIYIESLRWWESGSNGTRNREMWKIRYITYEHTNVITIAHEYNLQTVKLLSEVDSLDTSLSIDPFVHWSDRSLIHLSIDSSVHWSRSVRPLIRLSIDPSVHWSVCPLIRCREHELLSEREAVYQVHVDKEQQYSQLIKALKDRVRLCSLYCSCLCVTLTRLLRSVGNSDGPSRT